MVYDLTMNIWRRNGRLTGAGRLCQREIAHQVYCEPLPLFRASTVGLPSRSARFITSSSSTSCTPWASKALPAGSEDVTDNTSSSRSSLSSAAVEREMKNSSLSKLVRKLHLRSPRTQSLHCLSSGWTRAAGGQMIAPILSRKRDNREWSFFPQKKGSQWTHSIPSRTEHVCSSLKHITHRSCVSSSVRQCWHGSTHLLKRFSTDVFLLTLQKQGPLKEKRGWWVPQVPFYARRRSLACVIGVIMLQVTGHAGGVPKATLERGRSVEFPSEGNITTAVTSLCWLNILNIVNGNLKRSFWCVLLRQCLKNLDFKLNL